MAAVLTYAAGNPREEKAMTAVRHVRLATALIAALLLVWSVSAASAQTGTTRIIVPYPPGSGPDILSRLMAEQIGKAEGATVVIENRPGGGTLIGTEAAARAAPDGNTVLLVANSFVVNPALRKGNYDVSKTFEPICYLAATPMVLVVQGASPYQTLDDLIAAAKAKPGEIVFASGGPASSLHVAIEVLKRAAGISITYVPYAGTAPSINALMGGHVHAVWADYPTVVSQLKSGTLRGLVTTAARRVDALPNVPTLTETGLVKYEIDIFYGIVAPARTPPEKLEQLTGWFSSAMKTDDVQPKLARQGLFPVNMCGAPFGDFMRKHVAEYARIIEEAGIAAK
jgi:tripartite-type tricarboxylate transporter receptor subunit TctC